MPEPRSDTPANDDFLAVRTNSVRPSHHDVGIDWNGADARIFAEIRRTGASSDPFATALRDIRMPVVIADPRRADSPIVFLNDSFVALTGYAREEIVGRNCRFLQGPETDPDDVAKIRDALSRRTSIELDLCNHRKDGEPFRNRLRLSPVFDEDGELSFYVGSQQDVTLEEDRFARLQRDRDALGAEADRRAFDLARSDERLRFTQQAGRIGSWTLDLADMRLMASDGCKENFGRSPDEPFSYEAWIGAIHDDDREPMQAAIHAAVAGQTNYGIEYRIKTPDDGVRWIQFRGHASCDPDGAPLTIAGISLDVTARRQAEDHRDLLSNELSHRVRNTLATVHAIVRQTLSQSRSLKEAESALEARILSLAKTHDFLTRLSWDSALLADIVTAALRPFTPDQEGRFLSSGPAVRLGSRAALAFAMALHELATNAMKYGAFSTSEGRVGVTWELSGATGDNLCFEWRESGGPPVRAPTRTGFGSSLIEQALEMEIGGAAEIRFEPAGVVFTAEAAMADLRKQ
jgi:PAS domain S-box-containing protein